MLERSQNSYPLIRQFREFYVEVARLRRIAEEGRELQPSISTGLSASGSAESSTSSGPLELSAQTGPVATAVADENADASTVHVWQQMARYLDQKMYEVKLASSSISHDYLQELVFLMAAFADETFVCLIEWPGKNRWRDHLMELRIFHSQIAGQDIFRRIDKILTRQDYGAEELAAVYLMALALGFKGQYLRHPEAVEGYRTKLFDRLLMTNPDLRRDSHRLFPEAYRHTVVEGAPVRLPEPRTWWLVVAGVLLAWIIWSTFAWIRLTEPTRATLAIAMDSLERVTRHSMTKTASKWRKLPFSLQNGAFRLELPETGSWNNSVSSGGQDAPLLIAIQISGVDSAASAARVKTWLSAGKISFPANLSGAQIGARSVTSVEQMENPPAEIAGEATLFFLVYASLTPQELESHPLLSFPASSGLSIAAAGVTLYAPDQLAKGAP
jgi:type VI secretion system protein ImpK